MNHLQLCRWGRRLLEFNFPGIPWRAARFRGNYAQLYSAHCVPFFGKRHGALWGAVIIDPDFHSDAIYRLLPIAINWTTNLGKRNPADIDRSLLFILSSWSLPLMFRLCSMLDPGKAHWTIYRYEGRNSLVVSRCHPRRFSHQGSEFVSRWPGGKPWKTNAAMERLFETFPTGFRRFPRTGGGSSFRYLGLELVRSYNQEESALYFGPPDFRQELKDSTWKDFKTLVKQVSGIRRHNSREKNHYFYTWQTERWLEEMLLCHIRLLDPWLDERFVYSQVPAFFGGQRGVIDLLSINHLHRLVVVEIKVEKDPGLLFQALDYWQRVHRHNQENEFERRGFFPGIALPKQLPLLYLVAPALAFHPLLPKQASWLPAEIPIYQIGLQGDWRRKISVAFRREIHPGQPPLGKDGPAEETRSVNR